MFRRNLLTLAAFCTAIFFVGMTGYADAKNPNIDPICEGLSGAAYGLCEAAIANGCDGLAAAATPQCMNLVESFSKITGEVPPWKFPEITVYKFHDSDMDGVWDPDEDEIVGWSVDVTDPSSGTSTYETPETFLASVAGDYTLTEDAPEGTLQTVSYLDDTQVSIYPSADPTAVVTVAGVPGETHEVVYGNVGLGQITACKFFDANENGTLDVGEAPIGDWFIELYGIDLLGNVRSDDGYTDGWGCVTFIDLLPGTYTITEETPGGCWSPTGAVDVEVEISSILDGSTLVGTSELVYFFNYCAAS